MTESRRETEVSGRRVWAIAAAAFLLPMVLTGAHGATRVVPDAFTTIQAAIDSSAVGDTVLVRSGIYRGIGNRDLDFHGTDLVLRSEAGAEETTIDCEGAGRGFCFDSGETRAACVEGFTIRNGFAPSGIPSYPRCGGGIICVLSSPTIRDCRIINCTGWYRGGGMYLLCFSGRVERCRISQNASSDGAGLATECGIPEISDCLITGNRSTRFGGGVSFTGWVQGGRLVNCTITANVGVRGGGVYAFDPGQLDQCILWGNCAPGHPECDEMEALVGMNLSCCVVDTSGIDASAIDYSDGCVFTDPAFCAPAPCGQHADGDWTVSDLSPCLPQNNPCGVLIGAEGQGCGVAPPVAACCLADGSCRTLPEWECRELGGSYQGDGSICDPSPCQPTPVERKSWGRIKDRYRDRAR